MTDFDFIVMRLHEGDGKVRRPRRWRRFFFAVAGQRHTAEMTRRVGSRTAAEARDAHEPGTT